MKSICCGCLLPVTRGLLPFRLRLLANISAMRAWVWEHMALVRALAVAGDAYFQEQLEKEIAQIIALPQTQMQAAAAVCEMLGLIEKEKPAESIWNLKTMPGGIIDLEFIAQYAVLTAKGGFNRQDNR